MDRKLTTNLWTLILTTARPVGRTGTSPVCSWRGRRLFLFGLRGTCCICIPWPVVNMCGGGTLNGLEQRWASYGLVRIHNSFLVFLSHVCELRHESDGSVVILGSSAGAANLPISQRRFQEFKRLREAHQTQ